MVEKNIMKSGAATPAPMAADVPTAMSVLSTRSAYLKREKKDDLPVTSLLSDWDFRSGYFFY